MQPTKVINQAALSSCHSLLFPFWLSPYLTPTGVLFPSCHPPPHLSAWWQSPLHCPHPLSPKGRVPCLHPGVPSPRTHGCCLQSRRELGTFGCRGNGRACSCVPFVCLATARQVLHVTTFLREPVLPWHNSPRLPSSFQHPHRPWDVVLQRLQMQLTAPQSSFFFERKRTPTNAKRRTGLLGIAVHFLILRCLVSSGPS